MILPQGYSKLTNAFEFASTAVGDCVRAIYSLDGYFWNDDLYGYLVPKYNKVKHLMWVGKNNEYLYKFGKKPDGSYYRTPTFEEFIMINDRLVKKRLDKLI